ncbi:3-hydroxyacyl-CoA dehydrogenase NAD-binding domain-containing protein [Pullulanibacillus sp. KACC 23026]|uniref:3-hydroxyacyl-CoA dehydrogenase/enoyl-CoA hydratase family protein n=1 Tax=Pullulanibacillus sp. KACC 23026 TaxID=3028315 RepID=UPI0023B05BDD|nr:3-hydroxyacyl-CoA dehydrogenase/enoyl-CoA hydratase family protein [Pullulanibacillus sp. KACC 23026]WEG13752.1 3-hydroxyacyl-CoA dehydrogenase NAD-binding domain-containing protein [Pullulanibacillus sp. KACC 23026]
MDQIKKAVVIGSGVMGSGIAAHLANIGIPTALLDIVPRALTREEEAKGLTLEHRSVRNRLAQTAVQKLLKQKPAPLTEKGNLDRIQVGNLEDDLDLLGEADWIIEVVVENLDIKKNVFEKVDAHRKKGSIVSSNTSGISIHAMAEGRSEDFKAHFLGTHFFNPPRYLKLLEVIPTKDTLPEVVAFMKQFGEDSLGKGVVIAKDTPNFIGNRIGTYGLLVTVREMLNRGYSIGEIDSITGPLIGRPKSATFRTLDVVGLDTFVHVANNVRDNVEDPKEKAVFEIPSFIQKMVENGWIGSKSGQGFFLKKGKDILQLNPETLEYEARQKLKAPSIELTKTLKSTEQKIKALAYANDRVGEIMWVLLKETLLYTAEKAYEIADDLYSIDLAMKWGFGWELGPFETWDALGVEESVAKMQAEGAAVPDWIIEMINKGHTSFYRFGETGRQFYHNGSYVPVEENPKLINLNYLKKQDRVIKKNTGAQLIDLGDDVACLEFTSPNNALGMDVMQMALQAVEEVEKNYKGLVIGNQGKNFCVGANIALMLMEAQDDNYAELDLVIRQFHKTMMTLKYSSRPIVAAPFAMTLGGGSEVCFAADAVQASMETYMGLVEVGVGLIPGGGGNKELYIRYLEKLPAGVSVDLTAVTNEVFRQIATANVSTSAEEARRNGFLRATDAISVNGDHLLHDAKQKVLTLFNEGYKAPIRKKIPVSGEEGYGAMIMGAESMRFSGYASDHDVKIAKKLAYVLSGGRLPLGTEVDEQVFLDLEREAFLSLLGEPKTQQRMQHMLLKGKPLRN